MADKPRTKEAGGALEVEPVATFTTATAKFVYGPSNQKVTFVIGAGSIAQQVETTTNDEGDATVEFVPHSPGTLTVQVLQFSDPVVLATTDVTIST